MRPQVRVLSALDEAEDRGIDTCTTCPSLCRWACPVAEAEARETSAPQRLVSLAGLLKHGEVSGEAVGAAFVHCSDCRACTEACLHDNDAPLWIGLARARVLLQGAALPAVRRVIGHFGVAANPQGTRQDSVLDAALEETGQHRTRAAATVYMPGCATLESDPGAVTSFFRASARMGLTDVHATAVSASCCGLPLLWAGDVEAFRGHATRLAKQLSGVKRIVHHDPSCAFAMAVRYGQVGAELEPTVEHVAQFFGQRVPDSPLASAPPLEPGPRIAYMDPCTLARGGGDVEGPRRLIGRRVGQVPVELGPSVGAQADCCGAGGLLPFTAPATAAAMAQARLDEFALSKADRLVTASPRCAAHLRSVDPSVKILDLTAVLAKS